MLSLALSACSSIKVQVPSADSQDSYQQRVEKLRELSSWRLEGKISLDDGGRGGSGSLQWTVEPNYSELDFHGALGRGAWHLWIGPELAILREANGNEQYAKTVNALIQQRMGWPIPVEALQWWVRGLAAPAPIDSQQINAQGGLIHLVQLGWHVSFSRYDSSAGIAMPRGLDARRDEYRVKLAIKRWHLGSVDNGAN